MGTPGPAAIYARISSDAEGTDRGVARQVEDCQRLAERLGWTVAEVYDNDISAYTGKRRPAYERMLTECVTGCATGCWSTTSTGSSDGPWSWSSSSLRWTPPG